MAYMNEIILFGSLLMLVAILASALSARFGAPLLLVTRVVIAALSGTFGFIAMVMAIYYSGELVWRDRERRTQSSGTSCRPIFSMRSPETRIARVYTVKRRPQGKPW